MSGQKVIVTYKRKRPTRVVAQENGQHEFAFGGSELSPQACRKCDGSFNEHSLKNTERSSETSTKCVTCTNGCKLPNCDGCGRPYNLQVLEHGGNKKRLCCSCIVEKDCPASIQSEESCSLDAQETVEECVCGKLTISSSKAALFGGSPLEIPGKDLNEPSSAEATVEDNLSIQLESCHDEKAGCTFDSQCTLMETSHSSTLDAEMSQHFASNSFPDDKSCFVHGLSVEGPDVENGNMLSKDSSASLCSEFPTQKELPLLTFSRRNKRKITFRVNTENEMLPGASSGPIRANNAEHIHPCIHKAMDDKGCLVDCTAVSTLPRNDLDMTLSKDLMKDDDCTYIQPGSSPKTHILMDEEQLVLNQENIAKCVSASRSTSEQNFTEPGKEDLACCLHSSLTNVVGDSSSEATINSKQANNNLAQACTNNESLKVSSADGTGAAVMPECTRSKIPCLNLSIALPGGSIDSNILSTHSKPVTAAKTTMNSSSSTREIHVLSAEETSSHMLNNTNRMNEFSTIHPRPAFEDSHSSEEQNSISNIPKRASIFLTEVTPNRKCMQLFIDEKTKISQHSEVVLPEFSAFSVSEAGETPQSGSANFCPDQLSSTSLLLSLSLPTNSIIDGCAQRNFRSKLQFVDTSTEDRQIQSTFNQSLLSQRSRLQRHKIMLDSILNRASALNGKGSLQDKFRTSDIPWSEEELDFLWIGVRRYGQHNWDPMLRDPRFCFSPCRTVIDLAERWEEEQNKLLSGYSAIQFRTQRRQNIPAKLSCNSNQSTRSFTSNMIDVTRLSLGDLYAYRESEYSSDFTGFKSIDLDEHFQRLNNRTMHPDHFQEDFDERLSHYMKNEAMARWSLQGLFGNAGAGGNLPHWLREVVSTPPPLLREQILSTCLSSNPYMRASGAYQPMSDICVPWLRPINNKPSGLGSAGSNNQQHDGSAHDCNFSLGLQRGTAGLGQTALCRTNKQDDVIIINSDASSEETISDDNGVRT